MTTCGASKALPDDVKGEGWGDVTVVCDAEPHEEPAEDVVHCGPIVTDGKYRGVHYWGPGYWSPYI